MDDIVSDALLYGPEGTFSQLRVTVDQHPSGLRMRLWMPVGLDQLLAQIELDRCVLGGDAVKAYRCPDTFNCHEIFVASRLRVSELAGRLPNPTDLKKQILVGSDRLCLFRTHTGGRRHGSLTGMVHYGLLGLSEEPLLAGDSIEFEDGSSSPLPDIRGSGRTTEVLLPSRCVTLGEANAVSAPRPH